MKRIVARCTPNRWAESWNASCATLTCSTFHTNVSADQIILWLWLMQQPTSLCSLPQPHLSFFLLRNDNRRGASCVPWIHSPPNIVKETRASSLRFQHPYTVSKSKSTCSWNYHQKKMKCSRLVKLDIYKWYKPREFLVD